VPRKQPARFHGFLVIDKPAGWTSHDVVAVVRRLTNQRAVGHTGTLDPAATGVLPIALGDATKVISSIEDSGKTYLAEVTFGVATDTLDADGRVTALDDVRSVTRKRLEAILPRFIGTIPQQAPRFSAIQQSGRRLYEMARAGEDFEPPTRDVTIFALDLLAFHPPVATLCVDCSSGTYIRSLARDLGDAAGTVAHLSNLIRVRAGRFTLADTWTIDQLREIPLAEQWPSIAVHPDDPLVHSPAIILDAEHAERWTSGRTVMIENAPEGTIVRAYSDTGDWIGLGVAERTDADMVVQPRRVIVAGARRERHEPDRTGLSGVEPAK
jgi:tRNA pseudouridine55 synthase